MRNTARPTKKRPASTPMAIPALAAGLPPLAAAVVLAAAVADVDVAVLDVEVVGAVSSVSRVSDDAAVVAVMEVAFLVVLSAVDVLVAVVLAAVFVDVVFSSVVVVFLAVDVVLSAALAVVFVVSSPVYPLGVSVVRTVLAVVLVAFADVVVVFSSSPKAPPTALVMESHRSRTSSALGSGRCTRTIMEEYVRLREVVLLVEYDVVS